MLFLRAFSPSFHRRYITRAIRKKTSETFGSLTSQESISQTQHSLRPLRSSVTGVIRVAVRNKRAELIRNLGHARVGSFIGWRVTCQLALALNHDFG